MLRFYPIICSLTLLCACLFSTVATAQKSSPILKLKTEGVELPNNLQSFLQSSDVEASKVIQNRYFKLLQFDYLPTQAEKDRLLLSGVQLLEYVPDNAYIASFPINFIRAELGNYAIRSVVDVPRAIRLHPDVVEASIPAHVQFADGIELMVRIHEGLDMRAVENRLKAMGCSIQKALPGLQLFRLRIPEANISELESFAAVSFTEFAPEAGQPEGLGGRTLIRSNVLSHGSRNYTGEGITALVFDDGYVGPHVDFQGRINQQTVPVSFGGFEHADMVSGILAGAGNVNPDGIGMAPGVFLHINSYVNSEYTLAADEWNSFKDVQIFNASYSNGCNAGYTGITRGVDKILYENEGVMQVYSAGNSAASDCRYGAGSPWGTITGGHKQAKNCIANANLYADGTLVESSSRGPAHDGRLKPDLAAHGQGQLSISPNNQYRPGGGTSAASPSTAGLCAQLFEAYEKIYNEPAVAPLIKAALLNTAVDIGNPGPDFSFGWGQAHGGRAANLLEKEQFLKDQIVQGAAKQHNIEVPANVKEARFMVYWADPPAVEGAQIALVNNLDLTVSAPGGGQRLPLILDPTPDVAAITAPAQPGVDALNNVEQVRYTDPQAGTYSVNIAGTSIPEGPQEYFVVYYFLMDEVAITYPLDGDPLVPGRLELVHWEALGNNEPFELSYSLDDGNNWTVLDANIDPSARNYEWTPPAVATNKARLRIRRGVQTATSGRIHLIGQAQNLELLRVCEDDGTMLLNWEAVDGATAYEVRLLGDKYMEAVDTVDNPLVDLNLDPTQEHWIAVRAIGEDGLNGLQSLAINIQPSQFGNSCLLECDDQQDIGVRRIITPLTYTSGCLDNRLLITLELENKGDQAVSDPTASFKIDDEETITETVNGTVPAGGTLIYTFTLTPEITEGNHWLQTFASHPDDRATCNNSKSLNFDWQPGPQALPFREDFTGFSICRDLSTCGRSVCTITGSGWRNLNNITFDFTDWLVSNGTLYRGNFLPSTDHTSDQADGNFLMFSTSSACGSKNAILQSPCIDLTTAAKPTLEFWAFAGEAEDAEIAVEVSTDELEWSPIGTSLKRFDANEWTQHQISLEAYKGQTIYLRIIGIAGSATSYNLAIDDIQVFDANELSAPAFVASAQMVCPYEQVVLSDLSSGAIIERKWEITPTTFQFVGGSSAASNAPVIHFTQAGQYTVKLTSINNNGSRVSEIPNYITVGAGSPLPVQVDFEDWELCRKDLVCGLGCILSNGWRNALNGSEDQADWRVLSGTPSYSNYGPTVDHTTASASGKYLYVEPVNCEGQEAIMYSECLDLSNTEEPVVYWWQMSPDFRNSELHLDVLVDGQLIDDIIPPITGTPGSSVWTQQNADLSLFKGKSIILRFRAVTGLDIFARISIDDIDIYDKAKRPLPRMAIQNPEACIAYPVSLEDQSSDNTSSVQWRFEPSTYTFVNGTSANDRNVSVLFTQAGTYTAILTATNLAGSSEQRQEDIIQIGEGELLPYRQSFDSPRGCARSGACEITCPPMEGWTNAKNGTDDSGDWNIGRSNFGSIFAPPTDFSTRREGGYYANLNYKFGCGQMADLISPCIDLTNESDPFLSFAYYTGGDLGGSLKVDVYDNGQWEEILPLFSSNTKKWEQRQVSLKDYSGKIILVRFRGEAGNDYPSFIALDDVEFYNIDDAPVPSIEVSQEECIGAPVTLSNFSKGYVTQWKWEIEPNSFEFVGGTNDASQTPLVNFLNDGVYTITLNAINDAGTTSATTSMTIGQSIELPYENSFDAAPICTTFPDCDIQCNLTDGLRNATTDQNEWFVYNSRTFGLETGPTTDHTQGTPWGRYLYVPSLCSETDAVMSSPCIDLTTAQSAKMSFWYHMYGEAMGSLHIDLAANGQWSTDIVPPITGDQGDEWRYAEVSLNDYVGEHISLNFRALIGGITSDIAIDDLNIQVGTLSNNNLPDGQQLTVFPNPTNNRITLGWSVAIEEALDWQLYDHQGRLLKDGQFQTIGRTTAGLDLSDLPAGVYLLRIASDRWVTTEKVELIR